MERSMTPDQGMAGMALIMAAAMLPTALAWSLDDRTVNDINVWVKPLKFQMSFVVHLATLAWAIRLLPSPSRPVRLAVAVTLAATVFEVGYISWASAQGIGSHYNSATSVTALMYALMGVAAVALMLASGTIGAQVWARGQRRLARAAGLGLMAGSLCGGLSGAALSLHGGHWVGGIANDANGLPLFGWSLTGGDLRPAHFVGLHLMQLVPLAAWAGLNPRWVALGGAALAAGLFVQAMLGLPLLPFVA